ACESKSAGFVRCFGRWPTWARRSDPRGGQPTGSFAALTPRAGARAEGKPSEDGPSASRAPWERPVQRIPNGGTGFWHVTSCVQKREGTRTWVQVANPD